MHYKYFVTSRVKCSQNLEIFPTRWCCISRRHFCVLKSCHFPVANEHAQLLAQMVRKRDGSPLRLLGSIFFLLHTTGNTRDDVTSNSSELNSSEKNFVIVFCR